MMAQLVWNDVIDENGKDYNGKNPWLVVDPNVYAIILQADETITATESGFKVTRNGVNTRLAVFDIMVSTNYDRKAD